MSNEIEIKAFLMLHLQAVLDNDLDTYQQTTVEDLSLYEWWITPHRIDGVGFHDFMMSENSRLGTSFGVQGNEDFRSMSPVHIRFDLANLRIQEYGDTAIASYTYLLSTGTASGVRVVAHNESRVMIKTDGLWKIAHVHKSPAYQAPHVQT
jgi:hypothetical protein